jgi:hypothetical protein
LSPFEIADNVTKAIKLEQESAAILHKLKSYIRSRQKGQQKILELTHDMHEELEMDKHTIRARKNKLYRCALVITESYLFTQLISASIIANTVILSMDRHPID